MQCVVVVVVPLKKLLFAKKRFTGINPYAPDHTPENIALKLRVFGHLSIYKIRTSSLPIVASDLKFQPSSHFPHVKQ
jgi:hypothetical protein